VAAAAMGLILWWLNGSNIVVALALSLAGYAAALVALGTFNEEDRSLAWQLIKGRVSSPVAQERKPVL